MKQFTRKSMGLAIGVVLIAPLVFADAPSAVQGSLGGFSSGSQGGQDAAGWGIPERGGQNSAGQSSQSGAGQQGAGQQGAKGPDAGGYGNGQNSNGQNSSGQNSQYGNGQNGPGQQGGKGPDAGGYGDQNGSGQNSAGQQGGKGPDAGGYGDQNGNGQNSNGQNGSANGQGEHYNDGPTKNNSNNPDGSDSGHGEHYDDGPTKNNSNNPDGSDSGHGEHYDDGPTKNNSNNPDGDSGQGNHGNGNGSGSGSGSSGSSSSGGSGGTNGGDYPPLDPSSDGQYDPANNGGDQQIPSSCAEANSTCGQCMQRNEAILEFNRRYLHVAWSTTNKTLQYTKQAIAFGDGVSEMSKSSLSWQLTGKPQIIEAVNSLRATYDNKYRIYIDNMQQAMDAMTACEQDNNAVQTLYRQFSGLYLDFIKARYASPD